MSTNLMVAAKTNNAVRRCCEVQVCDATALKIRAYSNLQKATGQADMTETVQAKFHNGLTTPRGPYAELFGELAAAATNTLKVKFHYWRDGVVEYYEFPRDSPLDLAGK